MLYGELYKLVDLVEEEFLDWKKYPLPPQPAFGQFWTFVTTDIRGRGKHPEAPVPYEIQERFKPLLAWYRKSVEYGNK
jgi:hypothetical protein